MAMTKREMEELRPTVDSVMQKTFGFSDPTVVVAALNCVGKGMDENRTVGELAMSSMYTINDLNKLMKTSAELD